MKTNYTLSEIPAVAEQIIASSKYKILLFYGEMGTGKTTLIKEISKQLGVEEVVSSPTFSLVNEYIPRKGESIYHFDFYRMENEEEAYDIGVEEYFYSKNWCFVEWPMQIKNLLPLESVAIYLTLNSDHTRTIQIKQS